MAITHALLSMLTRRDALQQADKWHVSTCRGIKRCAPMPYHANPPYKLVAVGCSPQPLPAVVRSAATAALPLAKRRRVGLGKRMGSTGPAVPKGILTYGYSQNHGQRSTTARSLFHPNLEDVTLQEQAEGGWSASRASLDAWQKQRREVMQCVLQQQTAVLQGFKPASLTAGTQVPYRPIRVLNHKPYRLNKILSEPLLRCSFLTWHIYIFSMGLSIWSFQRSLR